MQSFRVEISLFMFCLPNTGTDILLTLKNLQISYVFLHSNMGIFRKMDGVVQEGEGKISILTIAEESKTSNKFIGSFSALGLRKSV